MTVQLKILQCFRMVSCTLLLPFFSFLLLTGCTLSPSIKTETLDQRARVETKIEDGIRVSAVTLSQEETKENFGLPLESKGVQPVWIEIENKKNKELYLMLLSIDPDYFSPSEVAWMFRSYGENDIGDIEEQNPLNSRTKINDIIDIFVDRHIPIVIPPDSTVSGYVYTNLDPGTKAFTVKVFGENEVESFEFVQLIPGFEADFMHLNVNELYTPNEIRDLDLEGLRQYLESLPCCVLGGDRKTAGDPLNLVLVGDGPHVLSTLVRQGWDLTETMRSDTILNTAISSLFGSKYRTAPVSSLYLFDRPQDIALQKTRSSVDERNHLRFWRTPVTLNNKPVWVGQISRDIGVKFSSKTFLTHKIDPIVDEARLYITLDMVSSQALQAMGYVKGVGYSDYMTTKYNYTDDPYYTDGLRVVLIFSEDRLTAENIEYLRWEHAKEYVKQIIK